jgi:hypothetical protein
MSGIETVCEFSEEYPGRDMYRYKRNLIQIMPEHRKKFRGAKARLVINKIEPLLDMRGATMSLSPYDLEGWVSGKTGEPVTMTPHEYLEREKEKKHRIVLDYTYTLIVEDPALLGQVKGKYLNWSRDISAVRRRLSRMLGYKIDVEWECERLNFKERRTAWAKPAAEEVIQ